MAYKNQKQNKRHVQALRQDPRGWRSRKRHEAKARKRELQVKELVKQGFPEGIARLLK